MNSPQRNQLEPWNPREVCAQVSQQHSVRRTFLGGKNRAAPGGLTRGMSRTALVKYFLTWIRLRFNRHQSELAEIDFHAACDRAARWNWVLSMSGPNEPMRMRISNVFLRRSHPITSPCDPRPLASRQFRRAFPEPRRNAFSRKSPAPAATPPRRQSLRASAASEVARAHAPLWLAQSHRHRVAVPSIRQNARRCCPRPKIHQRAR